MTDTNLKGFLMCGAFLQTGPDLFKVLFGPFEEIPFRPATTSRDTTLLYMPKFWDFLRPAGAESQESVYAAARCQVMDREEFIQFLSAEEPRRPEIRWKDVNEMQFRTQFDWSQNLFRMAPEAGGLEKTVPIIRQQGAADFGAEQLLWCLRQLAGSRMFGWSYGFFREGAGFVGHTPEILAQWSRHDRRLHTVALAGTCPRTPEAYDEIANDEKILHEHQIVIDDIVFKLEALGVRYMQGETDILELKYLLHLITEFELEAESGEQVMNIIRALHPTAAMGLYPASDLAKFRQFREFSLQGERGHFAAPFALFDGDGVACVVAIRNLMFTPDQVELFSGCGVTRASRYEAELTELRDKRDSVKKMLGLI